MVGNSVPVILVGSNSEQGRISSCRIIKFHSTSNMSVKTEKQQEEGKVRIKTLPPSTMAEKEKSRFIFTLKNI